MSKNSQQTPSVNAMVNDSVASVVAALKAMSPDQIAEVKRQASPSSGPSLLPGARKADITGDRGKRCVVCNRRLVTPKYHADDEFKATEDKRIVGWMGSQFWEPKPGLILSVDCYKKWQEHTRIGLPAIECAKRPGTYLFPETTADEFNALSTDDMIRTINKYYKMRMKRTMDRKNVSF
jgi:hypothetical protein